MSIEALLAVERSSYDVISVDLFDTLMLRDHSVQLGRFEEVACRLAAKLQAAGYRVDAGLLLDLRRRAHAAGYQAVAFERPDGDITLDAMVAIQLTQLGLPQALNHLFIEAEMDVEAGRLLANRQLAGVLATLRDAGKRVIAISDMYLSKTHLLPLLRKIMGQSAVQEVYVSCDHGLTKRSGQLFGLVAALEQVPLSRMLHCGDNEHADVVMSRAAGCQAVLLKRPGWMQLRRGVSALHGIVAKAA